jgi:glycosyltransferase involved in cell wall biosynthesis
MERRLRILHVSPTEVLGGAERVAWDLFRTHREAGAASWMVVGRKRSADPDVFELPRARRRSTWSRLWHRVAEPVARAQDRAPWAKTVRRAMDAIAEPIRYLRRARGVEDFDHPETAALLDLAPGVPDVLHGHTLHGDWLDLRALPALARRLPLVLTLHDAWLLAGHCSNSYGCERWETGCGRCPDLTIGPPIWRDATAFNWRRKRRIVAAARPYLAAPSRWLLSKVERSMLAPAASEMRVIPHGIDLDVFRPGDRAAARAALGLPSDALVLLFVAHGALRNDAKDFRTIRAAVAAASTRIRVPVVLVGLGDTAPHERVGAAEARFFGFERDPAAVARHYHAADVYLHAAREESFGLVIAEAMACERPVVATAVGAIPELVREGETGFLVPRADAPAMAAAIERLAADPALRTAFGARGAALARTQWDLRAQAAVYRDWFAAILERRAR